MNFKLLISLVLLSGLATAQKVTGSALSLSASEDRCAVGRPVTSIDNTERQIFFRFLLARGSGISGLTVEWLAPGAQVMEFLNYEQLPSAPLMCFVTQMPLAGFEQATKTGEWSVRVVARGLVLHELDHRRDRLLRLIAVDPGLLRQRLDEVVHESSPFG